MDEKTEVYKVQVTCPRFTVFKPGWVGWSCHISWGSNAEFGIHQDSILIP